MTCAFDPCDRPAASKGLCDPHRLQQLRGRPLQPLGKRRPSRTVAILDALWALDTATAEQIAERADASTHTVQALRRRHPDWFRVTAQPIEWGRHQPDVWSLTPTGRDALDHLLDRNTTS